MCVCSPLYDPLAMQRERSREVVVLEHVDSGHVRGEALQKVTVATRVSDLVDVDDGLNGFPLRIVVPECSSIA
jgi:hypothetical protein